MIFKRLSLPGRVQRFVLFGFWSIAIGCALIFVGVKLHNWETAVDAPEQSDFISYYYAAQISQEAPQLLYRSNEWAKVLGSNVQSPLPFLYMPATAVILQPLSRLPLDTARRLWFWASVAAIVGTAFLILWRIPSNKIRIVVLLLLILSPSTLDTLHLGQINGFLAFLVALSCLLFDDSRPMVSWSGGLLLGIACCIKPLPIGLALLALMQRRFTYLAGFVSGVVLFVAVGVVAAPAIVTQTYFEGIMKMSGEFAPPGITIFWNQSVPAFWHKLAGDTNSDGPNILILLSVGGIALLTAWVLGKNFRQRFQTRRIDIALVFLTMLLCSPITWWHYLLIVAPVYAGAAEAYFIHTNSWWRIALPLGLGLIVVQRAAERLAPVIEGSLVSSLMMFGVLIWLFMLARMSAVTEAHSLRLHPTRTAGAP